MPIFLFKIQYARNYLKEGSSIAYCFSSNQCFGLQQNKLLFAAHEKIKGPYHSTHATFI